jgi:hypothetical protein
MRAIAVDVGISYSTCRKRQYSHEKPNIGLSQGQGGLEPPHTATRYVARKRKIFQVARKVTDARRPPVVENVAPNRKPAKASVLNLAPTLPLKTLGGGRRAFFLFHFHLSYFQ